MKRRSMKTINSQIGTSLIEILVAVIISAIGLLGLAVMQNTSMKLSYDSYIRSQANFLAYDLIDRVRANPDSSLYELTDDATVQQKDCFSGDDCSKEEMRSFDLYYWRQQVETILPDAIVEITYDAAQQLYSLRINWDDRYSKDVEDDETKEFVYHFKVNN